MSTSIDLNKRNSNDSGSIAGSDNSEYEALFGSEWDSDTQSIKEKGNYLFPKNYLK